MKEYYLSSTILACFKFNVLKHICFEHEELLGHDEEQTELASRSSNRRLIDQNNFGADADCSTFQQQNI